MSRLFAVSLISLALAGCFSQAPVSTVTPEPAARTGAPVVRPSASGNAEVGPGQYLVKKGDTLYRIALEHGQDYRDLAAWNNLANPSSIKEGQVLRVAASAGEAGVAQSKPISVSPQGETRPLVRPEPAEAGLKRTPKVGKEPYAETARVEDKSETRPEAKADAKADVRPDPVAASPDELNWAWPANGKLIGGYSDSAKGLDIAGKAGDPVLAAGDGKVVYAGSGLRGYGQLVIIKHNATYLSAYAHNQKVLVREGQQVARGQRIAEMGSTDSDVVKLHFEIRRQGKPTDPTAYLPRK